MITKMIATINVNGAMILLTATMELIVEMSSVELFGPNVLRFKILSVLVPMGIHLLGLYQLDMVDK